VSIILARFNQSLIFATDFQKIPKILNLMQSRPVEVELFHVDGRTDRQTDMQADRWTDVTKLIVIFAIFRKRLRNALTLDTVQRQIRLWDDSGHLLLSAYR
jgi:hypothetical protein